MGFKEIFLIGVDFNWGEGVSQHDKSVLIRGQSIAKTHFINDYYEENEPWMSRVLGDTIVNFSMADSKGIQVHNVGIDSKLEVFPRKDFKGLFN